MLRERLRECRSPQVCEEATFFLNRCSRRWLSMSIGLSTRRDVERLVPSGSCEQMPDCRPCRASLRSFSTAPIHQACEASIEQNATTNRPVFVGTGFPTTAWMRESVSCRPTQWPLDIVPSLTRSSIETQQDTPLASLCAALPESF